MLDRILTASLHLKVQIQFSTNILEVCICKNVTEIHIIFSINVSVTHTAIPGSLLTLILEICTGNILIFLLLGRFSLLQFKLAYKVPCSVCYRTRACTYSEMIQCQFKVMPSNFLILKTCV